jgi:serine/threonine protein phosphatase PrpC
MTHSFTTGAPSGRKPLDEEIDVYGVTHVGRVRPVNQDNFLICSMRKSVVVHHTSLSELDRLTIGTERLAFLAMVADGVGGTVTGDAASRLAVEAVTQYVARTMECYSASDETNEAAFSLALQEAALGVHAEVLKRGEENPELAGMATTLTLWLGAWPQAYLLQVGDSRCYVLLDGELKQVTRDQTMAQELVDSGVMPAAQAFRSRWANVLSSSIGGPQSAPVVHRLRQFWGQVGMLCSDGLTKHVPDERIRDRLRAMTSARQVCEDLVQDALDGGGTDNITVVVGRTVTSTAEGGATP